jgi:hypothetical protein
MKERIVHDIRHDMQSLRQALGRVHGNDTSTSSVETADHVRLTDIGQPVSVVIVACLVGDICVAVDSWLNDREVFVVGLVEVVWEGN